MKVHRFEASTMKDAMRLVRKELGADAVMMGSEANADGVTLFATLPNGKAPKRVERPAAFASEPEATSAERSQAVPPQRSAAAQPSEGSDLESISAELKELRALVERSVTGEHIRPHLSWAVREQLLDFGFSEHWSDSLLDGFVTAGYDEVSWSFVANQMSKRLTCAMGESLLDAGGVVALVGPTGTGKTTTIAKIAGNYTVRHGAGSVGLISTDENRLGAREQLESFGRILDITVKSAHDEASLLEAVNTLRNKSLILIDTGGGISRESLQAKMLEAVRRIEPELKCMLVLAASAQEGACRRAIAGYGDNRLSGAVVTKLDECSTVGPVLSALVDYALPIVFTADGQQVPDDLGFGPARDVIELGERLSEENKQMTLEPPGLGALIPGRSVMGV